MSATDVNEMRDRRAIHDRVLDQMPADPTDDLIEVLVDATLSNDFTEAAGAMSAYVRTGPYAQLPNDDYQAQFEELLDDFDPFNYEDTTAEDNLVQIDWRLYGTGLIPSATDGPFQFDGDPPEAVLTGIAPEASSLYGSGFFTSDQFKIFLTAFPTSSLNDAGRPELRRLFRQIMDTRKIEVENFIAGLIFDTVQADHKIGSTTTPKIPTTEDAYDYLLQLDGLLDGGAGNDLDNADRAPEKNRWCIVPGWFYARFAQDPRFLANKDFAPFEDSQVLRDHIGWAGRLEIIASPQVPHTSGVKYKILAGHSEQLSLVQKFVGVRRYVDPDLPDQTNVVASHIYGAGIINTTQIACLIASKE